MTVEQLMALSVSQLEAITLEQQRVMSPEQLRAIQAGGGTLQLYFIFQIYLMQSEKEVLEYVLIFIC